METRCTPTFIVQFIVIDTAALYIWTLCRHSGTPGRQKTNTIQYTKATLTVYCPLVAFYRWSMFSLHRCPPFAERIGEVLFLLYVFLFGQRFLTDSRKILHAGVAWVGTCFLPFWGSATPGGQKEGKWHGGGLIRA